VTLPTLVERGLLRNLPAQFARSAPRIESTSPVERAALGYLHANCGMCHTGAGEIASLGFVLQYPLTHSAGAAPALGTSLAQLSHFQAATRPDLRDRIAPGNPDTSMLVARMDSRHPVLQMPPLGSRIVDTEAVALLRRWIADDTGPSTRTRASAR
jgi:hypothetical protein